MTTTTCKEEQAIARLELLHSAKTIEANGHLKGDAVLQCFGSAVREYLQAELDLEAAEQTQARSLPPFDATFDHDGETQPGVSVTPSWKL